MSDDIYNSFAYVYDDFMEDVLYDDWVVYLEKLLDNYNVKPKLICDLGCGTGNVTTLLAKKGYDMIGVDMSYDMLTVARNKSKDLDILYLCQDITELELFGTVDCFVSLFDTLNYITDNESLLEVFKLVNNYLNPGGLFIFDLNTEYKFKNVLADNVFAKSYDDSAYIWENCYDEESKLHEYYLDLFVKNDGTYDRFEEVHYEKVYDLNDVKKLLTLSGLEFSDCYDAYTLDAPKDDSERIYVVAKEITK